MKGKTMGHNTDNNTLILLPGMVCDRASWAPVLASVENIADCRVADYGNRQSLTDMAASVLASAPERFSLAGHSMGGRVAMEICRLAPERVSRLCLIATEHTAKPGGEAGQKETSARLGMLDLARSKGMRAMAEAWAPGLLADAAKANPEPLGSLIEMIADQPVERLQAHITAGESRPDSTRALENLVCPVLLIAGAEDTLRPASVMADMASLMPGCRFETIPDCGHMPMMEQPDLVGKLLQKWLVA
jgi:pimeloyl-ACP methyl ester carboxylesterase